MNTLQFGLTICCQTASADVPFGRENCVAVGRLPTCQGRVRAEDDARVQVRLMILSAHATE
jgi:ABC-type enterochelin transport system ATPase subunit